MKSVKWLSGGKYNVQKAGLVKTEGNHRMWQFDHKREVSQEHTEVEPRGVGLHQRLCSAGSWQGCYDGLIMKSLEGTERKSPAHSSAVGAPVASPSPLTPWLTPLLLLKNSPLQGIPDTSPHSAIHSPWKLPESSIAGDTPVSSWMPQRHPNTSPSPPNLLLPTSASHLRKISNLEGLISPATVTALGNPLHLPTPLLLLLHPTSQGSDHCFPNLNDLFLHVPHVLKVACDIAYIKHHHLPLKLHLQLPIRISPIKPTELLPRTMCAGRTGLALALQGSWPTEGESHKEILSAPR